MSPYETHACRRGRRAHERRAGRPWLKRITHTYRHCVWLNPVPEGHWDWTPSIGMVRGVMEGRMYPLTLGGLDPAMVN